MGLYMLSQVARRRERLITRLTDVRLLPRVRACVYNQAPGLRKRLATRLADVRFLP